MDDHHCIQEFEKLSERLGIEIRRISESPSSLCTVKGKRVLFLDRMLDKKSTIAVFIREFREIDLEGIFLVPFLRKLLKENDGYPVR